MLTRLGTIPDPEKKMCRQRLEGIEAKRWCRSFILPYAALLFCLKPHTSSHVAPSLREAHGNTPDPLL